MNFYNTTGCCTAYLIHSFDTECTSERKDIRMNWYRRMIPFLDRFTSYKLLYSIVTKTQEPRHAALIKCGFSPAFVAGYIQGSNHPETSDLTMYCITPHDFIDNLKRLLKEEEEADLEAQKLEIERRQKFPVFRLIDLVKVDGVKEIVGARLERKSFFPTSIFDRRMIMGVIKEMTGGWDMANDKWIVENLRTLTWGSVKDRALMYRDGKI